MVSCSFGELGLRATRPSYSVLGSERGHIMPSLSEGLEHYMSLKRVALGAAMAAAG